jgi:hypothetical protein
MTFQTCIYWSAIATAPAETSAQPKEAFTFYNIFFPLLPKIAQKELSYGFEVLNGLLSNQKKFSIQKYF